MRARRNVRYRQKASCWEEGQFKRWQPLFEHSDGGSGQGTQAQIYKGLSNKNEQHILQMLEWVSLFRKHLMG